MADSVDSANTAPFADNWAYLKWELRWLDRLLLTAVSRQRRETQALKPALQTEQDRVTRSWWQGIITLPSHHPREEGPPPKAAPAPSLGSYSQHLETRIQASRQAGVILALPQVRDCYHLTAFEKNVLLLALAPEVNRRYGRLYDYLQEETGALGDLPTVDLCLRLLCRSEQAWQAGRSRLSCPDSLMERGLVEWVGDEGTLLSQQVRLPEALVNYLLASQPDPHVPLFQSPWAGVTPPLTLPSAPLEPPETAAPAPAADDNSPTLVAAPPIATGTWDTLILPRSLKRRLQTLARQGMARPHHPALPGLVVLMVGPAGTGKTLASTVIAQAMEQSLTILDLATIPPSEDQTLLESPIADGRPLLVKAGGRWLGRSALALTPWVQQWWQQRRHTSGLTLVSVPHLTAVRPHWRPQFDAIFPFPRPDKRARKRLWQQAWPPETSLGDLDWDALAQWPLTGAEIQRIADTAWCDYQHRQRRTLTWPLVKAAIALHHPHLDP